MLDCMVSGRDRARTQLAALSPPVQLFANQRDDNAAIPHGFMWITSETPNAFRGWSEDLVQTDFWARSQGEAQVLENAVVFLDDWSGPSHGNAISPRWFLQSKTRFQEEDGTWHSTLLHLVRYGDRRKLLSA